MWCRIQNWRSKPKLKTLISNRLTLFGRREEEWGGGCVNRANNFVPKQMFRKKSWYKKYGLRVGILIVRHASNDDVTIWSKVSVWKKVGKRNRRFNNNTHIEGICIEEPYFRMCTTRTARKVSVWNIFESKWSWVLGALCPENCPPSRVQNEKSLFENRFQTETFFARHETRDVY